MRGAERWVVKVASGWPNNTALGLSNSQGVMLVFSQTSGVLEAVLADAWLLLGNIGHIFAYCGLVAEIQPLSC